jgi:hypothetical protein
MGGLVDTPLVDLIDMGWKLGNAGLSKSFDRSSCRLQGLDELGLCSDNKLGSSPIDFQQ